MYAYAYISGLKTMDIHVYACTYISVFIIVWIHTCMRLHTYPCSSPHGSVCIYIYIRALYFMDICMYAYAWISVLITLLHGCIYFHSHTYTLMFISAQIYTCHTCEWVMSHMWISHVAHVNESCRTCERVMSHMWMSHVAHVKESCHTCE